MLDRIKAFLLGMDVNGAARPLRTDTSGRLEVVNTDGYEFLTTPLTSTNYDGDLHSTAAKAEVNLVNEFGTPAGLKAILVMTGIKDAGSSGTDCYMILSPNDVAGQGFVTRVEFLPNNADHNETHIIPCNAAGNVYVQFLASGVNTLAAWIQIWGYWL